MRGVAGDDARFPWAAIALLGVTQLAAWGSLYYAITLLAGRIMAETGWPSAIVHGGFSLALVMSAIVGPALGRRLDRHGAGAVMAVASVLAAVGLATIGLSTHPAVYLLGWAACGVAIAGALYDPAFVALTQIAPGRARAAITALTLIGGFASTVSWPMTHALAAVFDWRGIYLVYAAFQLAVSAPAYAFILARATRPAPARAVSVAAETPAGAPAATSLARSPFFWAVALCFAANTYIATALTLHLVPALAHVPTIGERQAVLIGMAFGPAQVAARVAELLFLRRASAFTLGLVSFALMPFAMAAMVFAGFSWGAALAATAIAGAGNGLLTIARGVLPLALFGRENFGANLGLFVLPARIAMAAAPVSFAILMEHWGMAPSFQLLLAMAVASFAVMLAVRR